MIDSHCHLDFDDFDSDLPEVINSASEAGVSAILIPGVNEQQWQGSRAFQEKVEQITCQFEQKIAIKLAVGIHPYFLDSASSGAFSTLEKFAQQHWVCAIGECGIDGVLAKKTLVANKAVLANKDVNAGISKSAGAADQFSIESQQAKFEQHIQIANTVKKPLIVHQRKSHHFIMQSFKRVEPKYGGIIHAFSGSAQDASRYIELGFKLGCSGTITYPRANKTRQVFKDIGLQHIVLETDAPDMPLQGFQGSRNEPSRVKLVAETLADLRKISVDEVCAQTNKNFYSLTT